MDPVITAIIIAWLAMKAWDAVKAEYGHTRDRYATDLAREHKDWSPRRVRRNAARRARAYWWTEIRDGFPTWKESLAEDKLVAVTAAVEARTAAKRRMAALHQRLEEAREFARAAKTGTTDGTTTGGTADPAPPPVEPEPRPAPAGAEPREGGTVAGETEPPAAGTGYGGGPWLLTATGDDGKPIGSVAVWDRQDLDRRLAAASKAGARVTVGLLPQDSAAPADAQAETTDPAPFAAPGVALGPPAAPAADEEGPVLAQRQRERDASGQGHLCAACSQSETPADPLTVREGFRVHSSHTTDPGTGYYEGDGQPAAEAGEPAASTSPDVPAPAAQSQEPPTALSPERGEQGVPAPAVTPAPGGPRLPTGTEAGAQEEVRRGRADFLAAAQAGDTQAADAAADRLLAAHRRPAGDGVTPPSAAALRAGAERAAARAAWQARHEAHRPSGPATTEPARESPAPSEGDAMPDIEEAETPYDGMQNAFTSYEQQALRVAQEASDDLAAAAAVHGFDRDPQTAAAIAQLNDSAQALAAQAAAARQGLVGRHADGAEYHGGGQDAHASAFRPS